MFLVGAVPAFLCVFIIGRLQGAGEMGRGPGRRGEDRRQVRLLREPAQAPALVESTPGSASSCAAPASSGSGASAISTRRSSRSIVAHHLAASHLSPEALASQKAYWGSVGLLLQNIGGFTGMMTLAWLAQARGRRIAFALALLASFLSTVLVFRGLRNSARSSGCCR